MFLNFTGIASQEGNETCVRLLLMQGANPLVSDHCGRNAIKIAAKSGHDNIVKLLEQFCPLKNESNIKNKLYLAFISNNELHF